RHHQRGDVHARDGHQADSDRRRPSRPVEPGDGGGDPRPPASGRRRRPGPALDREGPDRAREVIRQAGAGGLLFAVALALGACDKPVPPPGGAEGEGDQVPRPEWRLGDRWLFRRTTSAGDATVVTYRVTAVTAEGYTLRLGGVTPEVTETW